MRLFRMIVPVEDIERATAFYSRLLGIAGERVTSGRHYFDCQGVILACWDPLADGDPSFPGPNHGHMYLVHNQATSCGRDKCSSWTHP